MAWPPMFRLIAWAWAWETVAACAGEMESITSAVAAEAAPSRTAVLFTGIPYSNGFAGMTAQRHTRKKVTRILKNFQDHGLYLSPLAHHTPIVRHSGVFGCNAVHHHPARQ